MSVRDVLAATMLTELDTQSRGEGGNDLYVGDEYGLNEIRIDGDLDLLALADAILAAGWRAPECEHVWPLIPFGGLQMQACSRCGEVRSHHCLMDCEEHEAPTAEQITEARALFDQFLPSGVSPDPTTGP